MRLSIHNLLLALGYPNETNIRYLISDTLHHPSYFPSKGEHLSAKVSPRTFFKHRVKRVAVLNNEIKVNIKNTFNNYT